MPKRPALLVTEPPDRHCAECGAIHAAGSPLCPPLPPRQPAQPRRATGGVPREPSVTRPGLLPVPSWRIWQPGTEGGG